MLESHNLYLFTFVQLFDKDFAASLSHSIDLLHTYSIHKLRRVGGRVLDMRTDLDLYPVFTYWLRNNLKRRGSEMCEIAEFEYQNLPTYKSRIRCWGLLHLSIQDKSSSCGKKKHE